jgi:hydroxyethylthiazole kinase-like sugar kinase family protein
MVLAGMGGCDAVKGVDSAAGVPEAEAAAKALAVQQNCVVAVSGEVDYVRYSLQCAPHHM